MRSSEEDERHHRSDGGKGRERHEAPVVARGERLRMKFPAFACEMKIVEVTATPTAPPICWLVFSNPDASPAC